MTLQMEIDHDLVGGQSTYDLDNTVRGQSIAQWGFSGAYGPLAFYPGLTPYSELFHALLEVIAGMTLGRS